MLCPGGCPSPGPCPRWPRCWPCWPPSGTPRPSTAPGTTTRGWRGGPGPSMPCPGPGPGISSPGTACGWRMPSGTQRGSVMCSMVTCHVSRGRGGRCSVTCPARHARHYHGQCSIGSDSQATAASTTAQCPTAASPHSAAEPGGVQAPGAGPRCWLGGQVRPGGAPGWCGRCQVLASVPAPPLRWTDCLVAGGCCTACTTIDCPGCPGLA